MTGSTSDVRYSVNTAAVQWRIVDGEAVIVNVQSSYYYGLNRTGTLVWSLLTEAARTLDEIASHVAREYSIEVPRARTDAMSVLRHLVEEGLVKEE